MNKLAKILVLLGAVAPMATFGVSPDQPATNSGSSTDKLQSLFSDSVVVKGKGVEVKRNELDQEVVSARSSYAAYRAPAPPDLEQQALRGLVIKQLVLNKATDADKAEGKKDFETRLAKLKKDSGLTDEQFEKRLAAQLFGQTREQWEKGNVDTLTVPVVLQRELGVKVSDEDAKKFYDDPKNIAKFEQPEMVRVSHILLMTTDPDTKQPLSDEKKAAKRKQLEALQKRARAGEDFTKLADQYSEDPGVKENHGEYTFGRGDRYVEEFKAAAFALTNVNDVSDIVTTQYGYHIIKLDEKLPAKKVDFDKVKDRLKDALTQEDINKQLRPYVAKLEKDADVKILDDNLKDTDLLPQAQPAEENAPTAASQAQKAK
jgi:parvulin-like peptidyl-prolyl isomerase